MANPLAPTKDNYSRTEISSVADHHEEETEANSNYAIVEIPKEEEEEERRSVESEAIQRCRILYRVPPQLRENKKHIYDPVVLSLGPYHDEHRKFRFRQVEKFKDEVLNGYIDSTYKGFLISKILERIDEIRIFYGEGVSTDKYNDGDLAEMMLRDGLFVLYCMEMGTGNGQKFYHCLRRLGCSIHAFLCLDMLMLENQIPFWLIKLLITSTYDDRVEEGKALVCRFLSSVSFGDTDKPIRDPWELEGEQEPLHLLEAHRTILVQEDTKVPSANIRANFEWIRLLLIKCSGWKKSSQSSSPFEETNSPFRSVTDLKAKGIHFGPSSTCLTDIKFKSYWFYGKLQLPTWNVGNNEHVFFSNLIAFEMSPEISATTNFAVLAYVNFMKSLIENSKDVKELREKGILFSDLRNDEEVMKIFKGIDTYGMDNVYFFQKVKTSINKHCESKGKTWMAEFIHSYFHSPWTAIALFAATFLLWLTVVQTYYAINPRN